MGQGAKRRHHSIDTFLARALKECCSSRAHPLRLAVSQCWDQEPTRDLWAIDDEPIYMGQQSRFWFPCNIFERVARGDEAVLPLSPQEIRLVEVPFNDIPQQYERGDGHGSVDLNGPAFDPIRSFRAGLDIGPTDDKLAALAQRDGRIPTTQLDYLLACQNDSLTIHPHLLLSGEFHQADEERQRSVAILEKQCCLGACRGRCPERLGADVHE
ncbi:hypothetical protein BON30_03945 [Cystobacter ferrugineus]|uniref:Uncharacterized protein n=1 Tax=Cystobacter ferrugineus TaxID=83449 RepID=A0A1L9BJH8_9BACT|nr:hypothetical protein BON30_03945 [Cystobacter ferrugineus]